jgi:F-type H+-transporting ATPase subunit b
VNINATMFGQMISFVFFVWVCMKYVWPVLMENLRERQRIIAQGLENAAAAEKQLESANDAADVALEEAKKQSAELIGQARSRANQIVEEAKGQATEEATRIVQGAQSDIDQEINRAREELRARVSDLAVEGAEKILESSIDRNVHQGMLNNLAAQL